MNEIVKVEKDKDGYYRVDFFGNNFVASLTEEGLIDMISKYNTAYKIIPKGSTIIPYNEVSKYNGKLIGGILADSLYAVYGIGNNGLKSYYCSIYFIPPKSIIDEFIDYP